jgi:hypothetical protein
MESTGGGILGRLGEKFLGWIALGLLILLGIGIWQMGPTGRAAVWSGIWRTLMWIAIAGGLPWLSRLFVRRILEIGSNWAAVIVIAAYTLVDAILGLVLMGGLPGGGWSWLAALAALAVAGTYNYLVNEYLAEMSGG